MKILVRTFSLTLVTFCLALASHGAAFVVNTTADTQDATPGNGACADSGGSCSLRAAITEANALAGDDVITLPAGTYTQSLAAADEDNNAGGDWDIKTRITINGADAATTIVQASAAPNTATERVLHVTDDFTVDGIAVLALNNVTVRHGNDIGTTANDHGGGIFNRGNMTVTNSVITLNRASNGGGISAMGRAELIGVTVSNNSCVTTGMSCFGGGMQKTQGGLSTVAVLINCQFLNNTSTSTTFGGFGFGGGLAANTTTSIDLTITDTLFDGNDALTTSGTGGGGAAGGGLYISTLSGTSSLSNSTFINNTVGGGQSPRGGGIMVSTSGPVGGLTGTWNKLTVDTNTGGGIVLENATPVGMKLNINNSTISGNHSDQQDGAGISISSTGGNLDPVAINFLNTTISANFALISGGGVGVLHSGGGTTNANFNYCTIANNTATTAAGGGLVRIASGVSNVNLKNTVVAANNAPSATDISGVVNSQDYNHVENLSGSGIGGVTTHNSTGPANLGALQINGSGPRTQLPGAGSPLLDKIPSGASDCGTAVTLDERSITRPQGGLCDIGAAEVEFPAGPFNLAGRVLTSDGRPIANVVVSVTGGTLPAGGLKLYTSTLGYYFAPALPGSVYTVLVKSRKFHVTVDSLNVSLNADVLNADFTADSEIGKPAPRTVKPDEIAGPAEIHTLRSLSRRVDSRKREDGAARSLKPAVKK